MKLIVFVSLPTEAIDDGSSHSELVVVCGALCEGVEALGRVEVAKPDGAQSDEGEVSGRGNVPIFPSTEHLLNNSIKIQHPIFISSVERE